MSKAYKRAGVDIDAGNRFVELIKPIAKTTVRRGVVTDIGGYGGLFSLDLETYPKPILVSSTDGCGTKVLLARDAGDLSGIGIDLVAMCVNDVACYGAEPLFFLDYFATGCLKPDEHAQIIESIARGCKTAGCALIGGETAEMPGVYKEDDFDLAGFAVGVVNADRVIDGSAISASHIIIGIASSGFHSNGYSLIRRFLTDAKIDLSDEVAETGRRWKEALLAPTKIYSPLMLSLARNFKIDGFIHITGGGFLDNTPRILPGGVKAIIDKTSWNWPSEVKIIAQFQGMNDLEAMRIFNCGVGMLVFTTKDQSNDIIDFINGAGETAYIVGRTAKREDGEEPVVVL